MVDALRSCYSVDVHFSPDSQVAKRILWYFVPDATPTIDKASFLYPRNWDLEDFISAELGEVETGRIYSKGRPLGPVTIGAGCGTDAQWADGYPFATPAPALWPGTYTPICCPRPSARSRPLKAWTRISTEADDVAPTNLCCGQVSISLVAVISPVNVISGPFPRPVAVTLTWSAGPAQWEYGAGGNALTLKCLGGTWDFQTNCLLGPSPDGGYAPDKGACVPLRLQFNSVFMGTGYFGGQFLTCSDVVSVVITD